LQTSTNPASPGKRRGEKNGVLIRAGRRESTEFERGIRKGEGGGGKCLRKGGIESGRRRNKKRGLELKQGKGGSAGENKEICRAAGRTSQGGPSETKKDLQSEKKNHSVASPQRGRTGGEGGSTRVELVERKQTG